MKKIDLPLRIFIFFVFAVISGIAISNISTQVSSTHLTIIQGDVEVESKIINSNIQGWDEITTLGQENLSAVYFGSATHGWVVSEEQSLYRTSDSGKIWRPVNIEIPPDAEIVSISFVSPSLGWIVLGKYPPWTLNDSDTEAWILHTSDGGNTWGLQYNSKALAINRIRFINDQEWWAVGTRLVKRDTLQGDRLILHTTNGGKYWTDLSGTLNSTIPRHRLGELVVDIHAAGQSQALFLTYGGAIIQTTDSGRSWRQIGDVHSQLKPIGMTRIGDMGNGRIWVAGGMDGKEGMRSLFAYRNYNGDWVRRGISNVRFEDVAIISENQVLVCGSILTSGSAVGFGGKRDGVILRSSDAGRRWTIVYRNPNVNSINALAVIDSSHIWAVGDNGLVLKKR